jgi:hypothetical protein
MSWLRWWTGTVNDPKWRIVASRAKCRAGDCVAVWAYLLEIAKDGDGDVTSSDAEECAVILGYEQEAVEAIIAAMRDKGLIEGQRVKAWDKRQPKREDDSRSRVAAFRARNAEKKSVTHQSADTCNAHVTHGNAPESESESDTEIDSKSTQLEAPREKRALASNHPDPDVLKTRTAVAAAYQRAGALPPDTSRVAVWIENGFTADEITSCIEAILARGRVPTTLKYFDAALTEGRSAPRAPPRGAAPTPTRRGSAAIAHALDEVFENVPDDPTIPQNADVLRVRVAE